MLITNATIFRLNSVSFDSGSLIDADLKKKEFSPCLSSQRESMGFIPPMGKASAALSHSANGRVLFQVQIQSKILPASVVRDYLDERVEDIEEAQDRKVSNREKKDLREEIEIDLLSQAFVKNEKILGWLDPVGEFLLIATPSQSKAESVTTLLREAIGALPVSNFETKVSITAMVSEVANLPDGFVYSDIVKFVGGDDEKASFQNISLELDEISSWREFGATCTELGLEWENKIIFRLSETSQLKGIKFLDILNERLDEEDPQSYAEKIDIEFALASGEMSRLIRGLS